jgi:thiosulfate/3-mercaptopyruvate sulfurtransferase
MDDQKVRHMKKIILLFLITLTIKVGAQTQPILVTPEWLKEHLNDPNLVLVHVGNLKYDYDKEHIAGARYLWPASLAPDSPYGNFNAPDPKKATEILRGLGISNKSHIVLYHIRNEVSVTARMFLTLEYLGLRDKVSFLNGGMEAWKKAGTLTAEILPIKKGNIKVKSGGELVDKEYVLKSLKSPTAVVVDARMTRFYDGEPTGNPRDGHITGAQNIPYTEMVDVNNMFKPVDQLQPYFTPVADKSKEIVAYCFIGQTASVVYMAGRMLGYNMKLYDASLQEWSRLDNLPMESTKK